MISPVAQTILDQLGGRRFLAMTGAVALAGPSDLQLNLKRPSKVARVIVRYNAGTAPLLRQ